MQKEHHGSLRLFKSIPHLFEVSFTKHNMFRAGKELISLLGEGVMRGEERT